MKQSPTSDFMANRYQKRLLTHISHDRYAPTNVAQIIVDLGIDDPPAFRAELAELAEQGMVSLNDQGFVALPSYGDGMQVIEGEFRGTTRGFGFIRSDIKVREGDLFVPPDSTMGALSGDRVRVGIVRNKNRGGRDGGEKAFFGQVLEILDRRVSSFTGTVEKRGTSWVVIPDARELEGKPVVVRDAEAKYAGAGDKVVFEMTVYPEGMDLGEGVIVRVLGEAGLPDVETQAVIAAYSLPSSEFPEACVQLARDATREFDEAIERFRRGEKLPGREDLTGVFVCTIDPPDAKDYDDAISIRRLGKDEGGGWELSVHIADVAFFIDPDSALDIEAKDRGNSVYLPRLVIPMLPEVLSNGICSLQEGVERFSKTAIIKYNERGEVQSQGVASTIINSRKRMTYLEAQALIDGNLEEAKKHAKTEPNYTPELLTTLAEMLRLAKAIEKRRHGEGMITLELPDAELIFDEHGHVIDAEPEDDAYTHRLIEMFMVEANEVLGRLFERLEVPLLRRIHAEPVPGEKEDMQQSAMVAGFRIPASPTREELQGLLDATRGTPAARAVHMAVLRTLSKAEYSPELIGHYALASEAYAHFTSPIRRYPDLTVHRAMAVFLELTDNGKKPPRSDAEFVALGQRMQKHKNCPDEKTLTEIGRHCTDREKNAESAERDLRKYLILQLLSKKVGEVFPGVVTGVNARGLFVQIDKFVVDGFIKTTDLIVGAATGKPPRWMLEKKTGALVDANSGRSYNVGHMVNVSILHVDLLKRQLELAIADGSTRSAGKSKGSLLTLGSDGGGLGEAGGAGFNQRTGGERRAAKSKRRDKGKADHRADRKGKGKRQ